LQHANTIYQPIEALFSGLRRSLNGYLTFSAARKSIFDRIGDGFINDQP
jgi:hypothetical protein